MADRSAAEVFGHIFNYLAEAKRQHLILTPEKVAERMWELGQHYDFSWCQMECPEDLIELGFAEWVPCSETISGFALKYRDE